MLPVLLLSSCESNKAVKSVLISDDSKITALVERMTLEEKVAQLFVLRPEQIDPEISLEELRISRTRFTTEITEQIEKNYKKYPIGGIAIFGQNIKSPQQLKQFNSSIHQLGKLTKHKIQPLIFVDEEGGKVTRLACHQDFSLPQFSDMQLLTNSKDRIGNRRKIIYETGRTIGKYLQEYGFDVDFAPVCDVNTNPKNPVIGTRAFSYDPKIAGLLSAQFLQGLNDYKVEGCLKHFPGHGDTETDTHYGYAKSDKSWIELLDCEMIPFKIGIENGAKFIMTAHISLPEVTGNSIPATLSYEILTEKLRGELNYNGVIITDAMEMGAIQNQYTSGEAAILALEAGADIILMPYDFEEAFFAVLNAIKTGRLSEHRINESVKRILKVKK